MSSRLRIVNETMLGNHTKIYYVAADGNETEISDVVESATISIRVGELNRAWLNVVKVHYDVHAEEISDEITD